ncbi:GlxA family transcriptional regulator [Neptunomonas antarctica]|uniref:Transcriptional regulator, AraC family with amidase-like domain n=1 Tax=Neptunomonas antarctica TaxID=619304 RepID=A0A1N7K260_9GAMM|nr:GlxA family transcriptional regulator [Neptunomonas antarctica]SIS55647.1 transcriptional regulator, AraC family with amidase-like domain [Neptunomonas antarctica]
MASGMTPNPAIKNKTLTRVGFLLLDNFTMIALVSAIETLRMANQLSGEELFSWQLISEDGNIVQASDGLSFTPDFSILNAPVLDIVIVAGGVDITRSFTPRQVSWLRALGRKNYTLGSICTGAYVLAHAGLLDNYETSSHWECLASLQERYPKVRCNNRLYSIDKNRMTSSGGTTPMDMFLNFIALRYGGKLSSAVSDMFICDRVRGEFDQQRVSLRQLHTNGQPMPKLVDIIELMEANLEEPIELDELASFVAVSRRQLERMFLKHLDCSPSRYYLKLRLDRARQLLKQSSLSIVEISAACGFVSTPHFSRCYRKHIGTSPRDERKGICSDAARINMVSEPLISEEFIVPVVRSATALFQAQTEPSYGSVIIQ